ncbi:F-box domain-containing protein [Colletotrichum musicola]|uniref:F-box domain-containing protein n=1 Tax=Colletotrichum musicola TaxID=2175873 RepID=A0A8H6U7J1_9PEZI|nr:F-box domain-containing protein [Colletotrichum musicola]
MAPATRSKGAPLPRELTDPQLYDRPGVRITDFNEIALRMPRQGHFVGDTPEENARNPITNHFSLPTLEQLPRASSSAPLGILDFPLEVLRAILRNVDVPSLINFRHVNQASASAVDSLREFKTVAEFPKALSSTLTLKCASFTVYDLACALRNTKCSRCRHFGDYLYLITAERLCYPCWRSSPAHAPKRLKNRKLSDDLLQKVPHAWGLPGRYGHVTHTLAKPMVVFHRPSLLAYLGEDDDSEPEERRQKLHENTNWFRNHWYWDPFAIRFLVTMRAPYWDEPANSFVGGFFCRACFFQPKIRDIQERPPLGWLMSGDLLYWGCPWRRYTRKGFWEHLKEFGEIVRYEDGNYGHASKPTGQWMESYSEQYGPGMLERTEEDEDKPCDPPLDHSVRRSLDKPFDPLTYYTTTP